MALPNIDNSNGEIKVIWREQKLDKPLPLKTVVCSETAGECFSNILEFNQALDQNTAVFDYQRFVATLPSTTPNQARIFSDGRGVYSNISDFKQALNSPKQTQVYDLKDLPVPVKGLLVLGGILGGALVGNGPGAVAGGALMLAACGYEQEPPIPVPGVPGIPPVPQSQLPRQQPPRPPTTTPTSCPTDEIDPNAEIVVSSQNRNGQISNDYAEFYTPCDQEVSFQAQINNPQMKVQAYTDDPLLSRYSSIPDPSSSKLEYLNCLVDRTSTTYCEVRDFFYDPSTGFFQYDRWSNNVTRLILRGETLAGECPPVYSALFYVDVIVTQCP